MPMCDQADGRRAAARGARSSPQGGKAGRAGASFTVHAGIRAAVALMSLLFFVNTAVLLWHVDEQDERGGMLRGLGAGAGWMELGKGVPWVQSIHETVTKGPGDAQGRSSLERKASHAQLRSRGDVHFLREHAPGKHHATFRGPGGAERGQGGRQSGASGSGSHGEEGAGEQAPPRRFRWQDSSGDVEFALVDEESHAWAEIHDGKEKFHFVEQRRHGSRGVEIFDTARDVTVMLLERQSLFKHGREPKGELRKLYSGFWLAFEGVVHENPIGNYAGAEKPPPPFLPRRQGRDSNDGNPGGGTIEEQTIAVTISAYRDPMCAFTLFELFHHAEHPERVTAVVVQQKDPEDVDCVQEYCDIAQEKRVQCYRDRVRVDTVSLDRARGVMPARYRQALLLEDEEFCLQVDSHSAFEDNWDRIALEDWLLAENEMAVITAYPNRAKDRHKQRYAPQRCSTKFSANKEVVHGGNSALNVRPGSTPYLIPFFGAGTGFSKCHAVLSVPYDPYMSYLFGGEEFNRAVRLFTSGYDMYGPKRNFVYHYYDDDEKPKRIRKPRNRDFFNTKGFRKRMSSQTTARWRQVLGLPLTKHNPALTDFAMESSEFFGLGDRRRIEEYQAFSRVNLHKAEATDLCDQLGMLKWQAFSFEQPFFPAGRDCPYQSMADIRANCCTTLDHVRAATERFLGLENSQVADHLRESKQIAEERTEPIITATNTRATLLTSSSCRHERGS